LTNKELSQLYYLNREIETEKKRILSLREAATSTAAKISGLPHVGSISDKTAIAAEIADIQQIIEHKQQLAILEYNRLTRYIATVEDSLMRQILRLRYIDGLSWAAVAIRIGGNNTASSVKKKAYRYLKKE
jgi:hypothetical protein